MRLLITGGSGFIGKNLVENLSSDFEILAPSSKVLDLTDELAVKTFMSANPVDVIIHSATTPGHRNAIAVPDLVARNCRMFHNLARNEDKYKKFLYLGSGAVYDMRYYMPKMREDYYDQHVPVDPHGFSKYVISKYVEHNPKIIELRLFGVFGKYEDYSIRFISNAICKSIFGLPITIKQNRFFDYLFIDDLVKILCDLINSNTTDNIFNVTPDNSISLVQIAEIIKEVSNKDIEINISEKGLGLEYSGNNKKLYKELPQTIFTPIKSAIENLYIWYNQNQELINKELLLIDK
jgi:GDP-L-fucose synthase